MSPQNIYDDPTFFAGYAQLPRTRQGLDAAFEWPAFQRLLPALRDRRVLDLGCGLGYFAREARARTDDPGVTYVRAALETYQPAIASFDLVVASLALHYIADYPSVVRRVAANRAR